MTTIPNRQNFFPWYGYLGGIVCLISWYFNWSIDGLRTHIIFFPLWLGYCLFIDALVKKRKGKSLLSKSWKRYIGLFILSIPVWWFFELINLRTQNWQYVGREHFSDLSHFLYSSLCFSTVIPAVFGTAEFFSSFSWLKRCGPGPRIPSHKSGLTILFIIGIIGLMLLLLLPDIFYFFVWLSVFFIMDVINHLLGNRSLVAHSDRRDWKPMIALALGCLVCGFFWEMWNFYAYPKWIYHTPGVEFFYLFEMPILGYLGYIPFSFELFAFYHLVTMNSQQEKNYYLEV